jgi:hypothetical protein
LNPATDIDPGTVQAFLEAEYRVHGEEPCTLRVGQASQELARLHERHKVASSAFITAWNPYSEVLDDQRNANRQRALEVEIQGRGWLYLDGIGRDPMGKWPGEPSFLVFGLSKEEASAMGRRSEQNAIIWCGGDAAPQLVLLR